MIALGPWFLLGATIAGCWRLARGEASRRINVGAEADSGLCCESVARRVGRVCRRCFGRTVDPALDRGLGQSLLVGVPLALLNPVLGLAAIAIMHARSVVLRRRRTREHEREIADGLAVVIDLFALALMNGDNTVAATRHVGQWLQGELAAAFAWCNQQTQHGRPVSDVLEQLPDRLGGQARPLVAALVAHDRFGAPIGHSLMQLAAESRSDRRRRAETEARRMPVALLFPLVVCVLPAFLLLTVVPVVAEAISGFDNFASP